MPPSVCTTVLAGDTLNGITSLGNRMSGFPWASSKLQRRESMIVGFPEPCSQNSGQYFVVRLKQAELPLVSREKGAELSWFGGEDKERMGD